MRRGYLLILIWIIKFSQANSQHFELVPVNEMLRGSKPVSFRQILPTTKGTVLFATTLSHLAEVDKMQFSITWANGYPLDNKGNRVVSAGKSDVFKDLFELSTGIKLIAEGPGKVIYFVTDNNHLGVINYVYGKNAFAFPPFIFPQDRGQEIDIRKIWVDAKGNLFIGTNYDTVYVVDDAANINVMDGKKWLRSTYETGFDKDSNIVITKGAKRIRKIFLGKGIIPTSFMQDREDETVLIGTNKGLFKCDPSTGASLNIFAPADDETLTITHIYSGATSAYVWVSTLEKGMGRHLFGFNNPIRWYPYKVDRKNSNISINTFCRKSETEFVVAPLASTPVLFNTETGQYKLLNDTGFNHNENVCSDVRIDFSGNLYLIKGDDLFICKDFISDLDFTDVPKDTAVSQVVIVDVAIGKQSYSVNENYEINNKVNLKYFENDIFIMYSARGFNERENIEFAWKLEGRDKDWSIMPFSLMDEKLNGAYFTDLEPGNYNFVVKVRRAGEEWRKPAATLSIRIRPPFWRTFWFWVTVIGALSLITYIISSWRAKFVRKQEREKAKHEKDLVELEAKALRAQMNPHFIFNCLNSIKSLIQEDQKSRAVTYLTTFSKLIRTLFNNADRKQISLHDEIETCKLYLQLESMRFDERFSYRVEVDENIDIKSINVPALIIQPFVENAIWHGIVPKGAGGIVSVNVCKHGNSVQIIVDDNGIGRQSSQQNKPAAAIGHQSKGVCLTQSRLELDNILQERKASLEIVDKSDDGRPAGTKVIITLPEEE